jgi:hypothetical protein
MTKNHTFRPPPQAADNIRLPTLPTLPVGSNQIYIGWLCTREDVYTTACEMLDQKYVATWNNNPIHCFGKIGTNQFVVVARPTNDDTPNSVAEAAIEMKNTFYHIELMIIGVCSYVPGYDMRPGDVAVSNFPESGNLFAATIHSKLYSAAQVLKRNRNGNNSITKIIQSYKRSEQIEHEPAFQYCLTVSAPLPGQDRRLRHVMLYNCNLDFCVPEIVDVVILSMENLSPYPPQQPPPQPQHIPHTPSWRPQPQPQPFPYPPQQSLPRPQHTTQPQPSPQPPQLLDDSSTNRYAATTTAVAYAKLLTLRTAIETQHSNEPVSIVSQPL